MPTQFHVPTLAGTFFRSPSSRFTYRGVEVATHVTVEVDAENGSYGASLDGTINQQKVDFSKLLRRAGGDNAMSDFSGHVVGGLVLDDRWYRTFEKALDMYIDMSGIKAEPKQGEARPTTLDVVIRLCAMTAELTGHDNYERGTLEDAFRLLSTEGVDMDQVLAVLRDGRAHAFRPGFTENRPETWLVEACIRLMVNT